jgi:hypothetical protein
MIPARACFMEHFNVVTSPSDKGEHPSLLWLLKIRILTRLNNHAVDLMFRLIVTAEKEKRLIRR